MASATDVPNRYDVVIAGQGYIFAEAEDVKATFGYTPTFITRQNVQGNYGDNQQDFWLTWRQKDWSGGEGRRYQGRDDKTETLYWAGTNLDVASIPGQVMLHAAARTVTTSATELRGACPRASTQTSQSGVLSASTLNLYELHMKSSTSYYTDLGAHGAGAQPARFGFASDGANAYLSSTAVGSVGVRKVVGRSTAPTYSTFSATKSDALCFLNNSLYGLVYATGVFQRYDTAGAATTLFQWKDAAGTARDLTLPNMGDTTAHFCPYGGDLLILIPSLNDSSSELWLYDGAGVSLLWKMPNNFYAYDVTVSHGIIFVSGAYLRYLTSGSFESRSAVLYWANGSEGVAWKAPAYGTGGPNSTTWSPPPIVAWQGGVLWWANGTTPSLMYYDISLGSASAVASISPASAGYPTLAAAGGFVGLTSGTGTSFYAWPDGNRPPTSGTVTSGLVDFDSSLDKRIRGIKVDFDVGTGGTGTVDIAYQLNDVDGSYTTLQTGATSGTEYLLNSTARSVSVQTTLNTGTATYGPILKRVSVRAVPIQSTFRRDAFVILCAGRDGDGQQKLRDGAIEPRDGLQIATDLRAVLTGAVPVSVTDEFGTFTAVIDGENFQIRRVRQNEYVAVVPVREV